MSLLDVDKLYLLFWNAFLVFLFFFFRFQRNRGTTMNFLPSFQETTLFSPKDTRFYSTNWVRVWRSTQIARLVPSSILKAVLDTVINQYSCGVKGSFLNILNIYKMLCFNPGSGHKLLSWYCQSNNIQWSPVDCPEGRNMRHVYYKSFQEKIL